MNPTKRAPGSALLLAAAAALLLSGLAGCGEDPAVCEDVSALQGDVDDLRAIDLADLGEGGLDELSNTLAAIETDLGQLSDDASAEYDDEVAAVTTASDVLRSSVDGLQQDPSAATLAQLPDAVSGLADAVRGLTDAVQETC
jgi:uncharacterized phage infection (PIP) family protein YhgE